MIHSTANNAPIKPYAIKPLYSAHVASLANTAVPSAMLPFTPKKPGHTMVTLRV